MIVEWKFGVGVGLLFSHSYSRGGLKAGISVHMVETMAWQREEHWRLLMNRMRRLQMAARAALYMVIVYYYAV